MNDKLKHDGKGFLLGNPLNDPEIDKKLGRIDENTSAALGYLKKIAGFKAPTSQHSAVTNLIKEFSRKATTSEFKKTAAKPVGDVASSTKLVISAIGAAADVKAKTNAPTVITNIKQADDSSKSPTATTPDNAVKQLKITTVSLEKTANLLDKVAAPKHEAITPQRGYGKMFEASMPRTPMQKRMDKVRSYKINAYRKASAFKAAEAKTAQPAPTLDMGGGLWSGLKTAGSYALGGAGLWAANKLRSWGGYQQSTAAAGAAQSATANAKAPTMLGRAADLVKKSSVGQDVANVAGKASGAAKFAGKLLRRLPWVGALLGAGDVAASEMGDGDRATKDKSTGKAIGGIGGALAGGMAGGIVGAQLGAFAGPIGMAIGGVIGTVAGAWFGDDAGKIIGEKFGEVVTLFREGKLFDAITAPFKDLGKSITDSISNWWKNTKEDADRARDGRPSLAQEAATKKAEAEQAAVRENKLPDTGAGAGRGKVNPTTVDTLIPIAADAAVRLPDDLSKPARNTARPFRGGKGGGAPVVETPALPEAVPVSVGTMYGNVQRGVGLVKERLFQAKKAVSEYTSDPKQQAMIMANFDHESDGFKADSEGLSYSIGRLKKMSAGGQVRALKGLSDEQLSGLANNPEKLGNTMYGGRMGNDQEGDGYKFRGRGAIQLTGKDNYKRIGDAIGVDLVSNPDLLSDPAISAKASIEYLKQNKASNLALEAGDSVAFRKSINGSSIGLSDTLAREKRWNEVAASDGGLLGAAGIYKPMASSAIVPPPIQIPPMPKTESQQMTQLSTQKQAPIVVQIDGGRVSQDVRDDRIAHTVSGGISKLSGN
jgi:predicted chitinase